MPETPQTVERKLTKAEQKKVDKIIKVLKGSDRSLIIAWTADNKLITFGSGIEVGLETCEMLAEAISTILTDILSKQLSKELALGPHRRTIPKTNKAK